MIKFDSFPQIENKSSFKISRVKTNTYFKLYLTYSLLY